MRAGEQHGAASALPRQSGETLHLAWTGFQRRQQAMAAQAGLECIFLPRTVGASRAGLAAEYAALYRRTLALLRARRPRVLWMQLPPMPLLWAALQHRRWVDPRMKLVADCHNAVFGRRWSRLPWGISLLRHCDLVVVHNEVMTGLARARGVPQDVLFELEDVPPQPSPPTKSIPHCLQERPRPWILVPGSFSADEPVAELLQTARLRGDWTFVLTGAPAKARRFGHDLSSLPANVLLTGYLDPPQLDAVLQAGDVVLALTKEDGIQLSVCNEALGFGKPLVVSDTPLLRRLFGAGAMMVDSSRPEALAAAIAQVLEQAAQWQQAAVDLAARRRAAWTGRYEALVERLAHARART
ncbi:MAG TPA: glycosyltransferase [Rubrivivax sp.]|nr:glycosyltransferase [Rubrivivax sp.]